MADPMSERPSRCPGVDQYSAGYSPHLLQAFSTRSVARDAAFLLPHLRSGMRLLDCGCGPGAITVDLARIVAPAEAVGIDIETSQFTMGMARTQEHGVSNVRFAAGDTYRLPFPDETFEAVCAHAVLYHLREPHKALAEVYRVLKPGGVVGIRDADHGGNIYAPEHSTLDHAWALIDKVMQHHGGNPFWGRTHRALLRTAGFVRAEASASYDYWGTSETIQRFTAYWIEYLSQLHADLIIEQQWVDTKELEDMTAALKAWSAHPDAFFARARCEAVGWKE